MTPGTFTPSTHLGRNTLELLWSRTRQQGDMPGFAKAIGAILSAMRGEDDHEFDMTKTVLSDPVLTHKVLRLANSGMYSAFGQRVNTVSKAVLVLGIDAIGHLALGLKLIEELSHATPDSVSAHVEMEKAVLAGMVAQQVATSARSLNAEQAVVCSMLHTLGRMMVTFYMTDFWARMQTQAGIGNEPAAAAEVLGLSLEEVGYATAAHWGLPQHLINGMRPVAPSAPGEPVSRADWMAGLCTMAARCADLLWHDAADGAAEVRALVDNYSDMLGIAPDGLFEAVEKAKSMAAADLSIAPLSKPAERRAKALASTRLRAEGNRILVSGLADLRGAISSASPGQMVSMALETLHQGFDFSRSVAFVRNHKERTYSARLSLGEAMQQMQPLMVFGDAYEPNVFHAALNSDRVIFIDNARDPKFAAKLPQWWKATLPEARSFVIVPLSSNGHPTGFIYGDWDDSFPAIQLNQTEFGLINDIRALLVQSVEMRHQLELVAHKVA
ncbi:HDOD domain-containing protein [Janthinobacterium agaricidamnosum]|uniref:HDOD domain protein n=1 Tax=Janthinobacterium agaricidamnosum NBRC 102515 = DSM 9628 TaxID=1349767 RepID=W0V6B8_9BURK|nr:HDOD domain-containing protein [Janthinobacterium agaricidamnosum]CDG82893.1 HDOD domain protein [Janthinobacterium agaricidamnosum NBRC 102515 = DSM 9628]